jgi:Innexin
MDYHWSFLLFTTQAFLFRMPCIIWRPFEEGTSRKLVNLLTSPQLPDVDGENSSALVVEYIKTHPGKISNYMCFFWVSSFEFGSF